jgi:hypothetical protein
MRHVIIQVSLFILNVGTLSHVTLTQISVEIKYIDWISGCYEVLVDTDFVKLLGCALVKRVPDRMKQKFFVGSFSANFLVRLIPEYFEHDFIAHLYKWK